MWLTHSDSEIKPDSVRCVGRTRTFLSSKARFAVKALDP